jgi:single-strand DNA-binding protein
MNKLSLVGRLVRDPDTKYSQSGKTVTRFTVAVQRKFKNANGQYDSDFIPCVCFDKSAEFIEKYFKKGDMIGITGHLQSGSYEGKNGKVYTLDCYVDESEFVGSKSTSAEKASEDNTAGFNVNDGFSSVSDDLELPFK